MGNPAKKRIAAQSAVFLVIVFFVLSSPVVFSADYDFYVDADYEGEEKGTEDEPFVKISDAIDEAEKKGGTVKIYIKNGEYDEEIVLSKEVKLYGQSASGVVIKDGMEMKDGSSIKDLTISGGSNAINVVAGADVEIDNCRIRNFSRIGINALAGSGKIKMENSSIFDGGTKGMYIQAGREIELVGNLVYDNVEEGIDIREEVKGAIKDNEIYNNGESGIEIVVGDSYVEIKNNKIQKNGSSGIATQFYSSNKGKGEIEIKNNTLSRNEKYGVDCNLPSGGNPKSDYWDDSLELEENVIEKNEIWAVNPYCGLIRAVDEEEEETNVKIEQTPEEKAQNENDEIEPVPAKTEKELEAEALKAEEEKMRLQQQQVEEVDSITLRLSNSEERALFLIDEINERSFFSAFFIGYDREKIDMIRQSRDQNRQKLESLRRLLMETDNEELKETLTEAIDRSSQIDQKETLFLEKKERAFSLIKLWENFLKFFAK